MRERDSAIVAALEALRAGKPGYVIAHVSDIHIDSGDRSAERTRRVMDYLARLRTPVDVVVTTGDIADTARKRSTSGHAN